MWTRVLIKTNARTVLRRTYWRCFAVCLVAGLLTGGTLGSSNQVQLQVKRTISDLLENGWLTGLLLGAAMGGGVIALLWNIFAAGPLTVGRCRYIMESRLGDSPFDTLFSPISRSYTNTVWGMFCMGLRVFLYSLLLVVPGIIKAFEYFFVPYLLAENPDMDAERAMELSSLMTSGEKWNIFVLCLSFIGWRILGNLTAGIGNLFIDPYVYATYGELYAAMRAKAFALGYTDAQELCDFARY